MEEILEMQKKLKDIVQRTTDNAIRLNIEVWKPINEYLGYEVSTFGRVRNAKTGRILKPGKDNLGYHLVTLYNNRKAKTLRIHTLVAVSFMSNFEEKICIDHINNNRGDNNLKNLRWCTYGENQYNRTIGKNNKSGTKGVSFDKSTNKWIAHIKLNGKKKHLGYHIDKEDAIKARQEASKKYFGEFANKCEQ